MVVILGVVRWYRSKTTFYWGVFVGQLYGKGTFEGTAASDKRSASWAREDSIDVSEVQKISNEFIATWFPILYGDDGKPCELCVSLIDFDSEQRRRLASDGKGFFEWKRPEKSEKY